MTARNKSERRKPARYILNFFLFFCVGCVGVHRRRKPGRCGCVHVIVFSGALLCDSSTLVIWERKLLLRFVLHFALLHGGRVYGAATVQ